MLHAAAYMLAEAQDAVLEFTRHLMRERNAALLDLHPPADAPLPEEGQCIGSDCIDDVFGAGVLEDAIAAWRTGIREPPEGDPRPIDVMIRGKDGLGWGSVEVGPRARPNIAYLKDNDYSWCGAGVASWYGQRIKAAVRKKSFASTYRLWRWALNTPRMIWSAGRDGDPALMREGDIGLVGPEPGSSAAAQVYGAHIVLIGGRLAGAVFPTVEANATGLAPTGERWEGVIRKHRPLTHATPEVYRLLHLIRPLDEDRT